VSLVAEQPTAGSIAERFGAAQGPSNDAWEVLYTTRAIRRFKPDPIPDEIVRRLADAAIRAPSGSNQQTWRFLFVRDAETKRKMAEFAQEALAPVLDPTYITRVAGENAGGEKLAEVSRIQRSVNYLARHFADVPLVLVPCLVISGRATPTSGSSIYPAMWNLQLAARALGIGSVLTTINRHRNEEFKALLGIPEGVETFACVPLGYPQGHFGVGPRQAAETVSFMDKWGEPLS
jgi:nitroreductase